MNNKKDKDHINEIIKEVINIEKKALYGNDKAKITHRRAKIQSVIEEFFIKLSSKN
jgi:hypothetical protein